MDPRFVELYETELQHVRESAAEFGAEFPKIAGRLGIPKDGQAQTSDPFVERMLEGFAFLAARVQLKLESEFPRFTESLLEIVYPHYLAPLPSMANVRFQPDYEDAGLADGFEIKRGSVLRSQIGRTEKTPTTFVTGHRIDLWPIRLRNASYLSSTYLDDIGAQPNLKAKAALKISLECTAGLKFSQVGGTLDQKKRPLSELIFHIRGGGDTPALVYEQIFRRMSGVIIQHGSGKSRKQITDARMRCRRIGFAPEEALLPVNARSFEGYRILREYLTFPERFLYFAIEGLDEALGKCDVRELDIILVFDDQELRLERAVDANSLALYCTPVINLFEKTLDQPEITSRFAEYILWPDKTRTLDYEIFDLVSVKGELESKMSQEFQPFYASHDSGNRAPAFYTIRRVPRSLSEREKLQGPVSPYLGTNAYLSLVDPNSEPFKLPLAKISVRARCTNRHLPTAMARGAGDTDFFTDISGPFKKEIRILGEPTPPRPTFAVGNTAWRLISHLSLNYLSLVDTDERQGAAAFRDLLKLYVDDNDALRRRQIEGVKSIKSQGVVRRVDSPGPIAFARGLEITVTMDENAFVGAGAFLFGSVLEQFFTKYVSLNSFTETVIYSEQRKETMRWPAQIGKRQLI
jgi:type VI secretion system protein ImpG